MSSAVKLGKRTVDGLEALSKTKVYYDQDLKGFGVRVTCKGFKSWIVEYRPHGGGRNVATKRMSLGNVGTLTPDEARKKAREILAEVRLGGDPMQTLTENRKTQTVAQFAEGFIQRHVQVKLKGNTIAAYETILRKIVVPEIGGTRINAVSRKQLSDLHRKVGQSSPTQANKMLAVLSSMFSFAALEGSVPEGFNPSRGIDRFTENAKERYLTTDEIIRIGDAIREGETVGLPWQEKERGPKAKHGRKPEDRFSILDPFAAAGMRLLLLTGARIGEILGLRWDEVDFERGLLHLPDSKTGKKKIVLNAPAVAILQGLPRLGCFVIAGKDPDKPRSKFRKSWLAVLRRAGVSDVRLHDLRHTHASFGVNAGMGLPMIGKLLGHTQVATTQRYAHLADDPIREASEKIGGKLAAALDGQHLRN